MMSEAVLAIDDLKVTFTTDDGPVEAVRGVRFAIHRGETLAIVGESGSGKSQVMNAVMGLLARNGHASGSVLFEGRAVLGMDERALNRLRGSRIGMIFQEPMTSLDPLFRIGQQMSAAISAHRRLSSQQLRAECVRLLDMVRISEPAARLNAYPHELSGGQRQRVMIAMAIANNPALLIADEPTTALDVTVQAAVLDLLAQLKDRLGMAIAFISHDLNLVRRIADRIIVMRGGEIVEAGATEAVFAAPRHAYTRQLIDAEPSGRKAPVRADAPVLLAAQSIAVTFNTNRSLFRRSAQVIRAVDGITLDVRAGETLGIVGESGSGKSTLGRALLRLVPARGRVQFAGRDISDLSRAELKPLRRDMQVVFQDPFGSLSPRMTVGDIVGEALQTHEPGMTGARRDARVCAALQSVGIDPDARNRFPHAFSGGQRQRIAIARAMILRPALVLLDEPTSALDRTVQRRIIELLRNLQQVHDLTYLFISHDLAVVRAMADRIIVMQNGRIVEAGTTEAVLSSPQQAYTQALLKAAFLT